jgi:hypothetical protein
MIYPPFAFYRALATINLSSFVTGSRGYGFENLSGPWDDVNTAMVAMVIECFVFLLVSAYVLLISVSLFFLFFSCVEPVLNILNHRCPI